MRPDADIAATLRKILDKHMTRAIEDLMPWTFAEWSIPTAMGEGQPLMVARATGAVSGRGGARPVAPGRIARPSDGAAALSTQAPGRPGGLCGYSRRARSFTRTTGVRR